MSALGPNADDVWRRVCDLHVLKEEAAKWAKVLSDSDFSDVRTRFEERVAQVEVVCLKKHVGSLMRLLMRPRDSQCGHTFVADGRPHLTVDMPLPEVLLYMNDAVKGRSGEVSSLSFKTLDWKADRHVCMDPQVSGDPVELLENVVKETEAERIAR